MNTVKEEEDLPEEAFAEEALIASGRAELLEAYDRHLKHHRDEPRETVVLRIMALSRAGQFDWDRFRERHGPWCAAQERAGWQYATLTFLAWVRAGMPPPPPRAINEKLGFSDGVAEVFRRRMEEGDL